jgi:hypothetical protein
MLNQLLFVIFVLLAAFLFFITYGNARFAKNTRIFIYMVARVISERRKRKKENDL